MTKDYCNFRNNSITLCQVVTKKEKKKERRNEGKKNRNKKKVFLLRWDSNPRPRMAIIFWGA